MWVNTYNNSVWFLEILRTRLPKLQKEWEDTNINRQKNEKT